MRRSIATLLALALLGTAVAVPTPLRAAGFVVNVLSDEADLTPGDGNCLTAAGSCTLRAAIEEANALSGTDTITFALGGPFPTIVPVSLLPPISGSVVLDGETGGATRIRLNGQNLLNPSTGLTLDATATGSIVNGVAVTNFTTGILINADGATVSHSWIGDQPEPGDNGTSFAIWVNGDSNTLQANMLHKNHFTGVRLLGDGNVVTGSTVTENFGAGAVVSGSNNRLGGPLPGDRNLIAGNFGGGVSIDGAAGTLIENNYIGTTASGLGSHPNGLFGIEVVSGSTTTIRSNLVSGHNEANGGAGIRVGGSTTLGGEVLDTTIVGNTVGLGADGAPIPNRHGVLVLNSSDVDGVQIGSSAEPNVIAGNTWDGVSVWESIQMLDEYGFRARRIVIDVNSIYGNGRLGVNHSFEAVDSGGSSLAQTSHDPDLNDPLDGDVGPNDGQNYPRITSAPTDGPVSGTLESSPNTSFRIAVWSNDVCSPSGFGPGQTYQGETTVTTDAAGFAVWSVDTIGSVDLMDGFTAIATRSVAGEPVESSEFSRCLSPGGDADTDGFGDAVDNCAGVANSSQENSTDGNLIILQPHKQYDDKTAADSDSIGDACDWDSDGDGLSDWFEQFSHCASSPGGLDYLNADSDGDRARDYAECFLNTDPGDATSFPSLPDCGSSFDADGDKVPAFREFCYYGTSDDNPNSDGDNCSDRREIMSINSDNTVNAIDLSQVAQAFGPYPIGAPAYFYNFDVTKDGTINAIDLSQVAQAFGACP